MKGFKWIKIWFAFDKKRICFGYPEARCCEIHVICIVTGESDNDLSNQVGNKMGGGVCEKSVLVLYKHLSNSQASLK